MKDNFQQRNLKMIKKMIADSKLGKLSISWFEMASKYEYSYHFKWLGRPIIQFPQDILMLQEIIWETKPDVIIETGIARGGSLVFYASMLKLLGNGGLAVGVEINLRSHNFKALKKHPLRNDFRIINGSSTDPKIIEKVTNLIANRKSVMVILDSNHTHDHVFNELNIYGKFVTKGCYLVVLDTVIGEMPDSFSKNRPWNSQRNPQSAVRMFLKSNSRFRLDEKRANKLLITVARSGYLKCVEAS